jgi:hypothetical protein
MRFEEGTISCPRPIDRAEVLPDEDEDDDYEIDDCLED